MQIPLIDNNSWASSTDVGFFDGCGQTVSRLAQHLREQSGECCHSPLCGYLLQQLAHQPAFVVVQLFAFVWKRVQPF